MIVFKPAAIVSYDDPVRATLGSLCEAPLWRGTELFSRQGVCQSVHGDKATSYVARGERG